MGNVRDKEVADQKTGLTKHECRLVYDTWTEFRSANQEYGVLIFSAFLTENPKLLRLFHGFRAMPLPMLPSDPAFRAHACTVAYYISAMVDNASDPVMLEAITRKNAVLHTTKAGVYPHHFDIMGRIIMKVMLSKDSKKQLTPPTIAGWRKLFEFMLRITVDVYNAAGIHFTRQGSRSSSLSESHSEEGMTAFETCDSRLSSGTQVPTGEAMKAPPSTISLAETLVSPRTSAPPIFTSKGGLKGSEKKKKGGIQTEKDQRHALPALPTSQMLPSETAGANAATCLAINNNISAERKQVGRQRSSPSDAFLAPPETVDKASGKDDGGPSASHSKDTDVASHITNMTKIATLQELGLVPSLPLPKNGKGKTMGNTLPTLLADDVERPTNVHDLQSTKREPILPHLRSASANANHGVNSKSNETDFAGRADGACRKIRSTGESQNESKPSTSR